MKMILKKMAVVVLAFFSLFIIRQPITAAAQMNEETPEKMLEEAVAQFYDVVNGDVFETVGNPKIVWNRDAVQEDGEKISFGFTVTMETKFIEKSPWDTDYMAGACDFLGIDVKEASGLDSKQLAALLAEAGYADVADELAERMIKLVAEREEQMKKYRNPESNYDLYAIAELTENGGYQNLVVYSNTDPSPILEERLMPLDTFLTGVREAIYDNGWKKMKGLLSLCTPVTTETTTQVTEQSTVQSAIQSVSAESTDDGNIWLVIIICVAVIIVAGIIVAFKTKSGKASK